MLRRVFLKLGALLPVLLTKLAPVEEGHGYLLTPEGPFREGEQVIEKGKAGSSVVMKVVDDRPHPAGLLCEFAEWRRLNFSDGSVGYKFVLIHQRFPAENLERCGWQFVNCKFGGEVVIPPVCSWTFDSLEPDAPA